ncbi:MAG TPA: glycogen-binding domain-containing protein [Longimicrobiales bacterium]|nr:glycogen-binding domain-containing protein [Longimicrobiales bacterium]
MKTPTSVTAPLVLSLALLLTSVSPVTAQTSELAVEIGGSRILPPTGVDGDPAGFFVAGIRGARYGLAGSGGYASLLLGRSLDGGTGGDFFSAEVGGAAWHRLSLAWAAGLEGRAFGFHVADPFSYEAGGAEASAVLRYQGDVLRARVAGTGGAGRSQVILTEVVQRMRRRATITEVLTDDLWRVGSTLELLAGGDALAAGVAGGVHRSAGGTFRSAGVRVVMAGEFGALEVRADAWRTPDGNETTGGLAFYIPWGGWTARGVGGKPEPDPLLLAEPGRTAGGLLLGRRLLGAGPTAPDATPALYEVVAVSPNEARVLLTVVAPSTASSVEVLGDFTLWEPVAMKAAGRNWTVEMDVPVGTHHFGFLVDGDWYLPDDAPDTVPDEWGRRSATLVVEGPGGPQGVEPS